MGICTIVTSPELEAARKSLISRYLAEALGAGPTGGAPAVWLAPTAATAASVRDRVVDDLQKQAPGRALLDPQIGTFSAYADRLLTRAGVVARTLTPLQQTHLLRRAIDEVLQEGNLDYFSRVALSPGMVGLLQQAIAQMKRRDLWAERFLKEARSPRDVDLARIYMRYQRHLVRAGLYDREGRSWAARDALQRNPELAQSPRLICVEGFTDFTAAELDILATLAGVCREMLVALPADVEELAAGVDPSRGQALEQVKQTMELLAQALPDIEHRTIAPSGESEATFGRVARHLYRNPAEIPSAPPGAADSLRIVAAGSEQIEYEEVARRVKMLLAEGEARPSEIVLVLRGGEESWLRLRGVLDDFGVPAWMERGTQLAGSPAFRLVSDLLGLVAEDWPRAALLRVVTNQAVSLGVAGDARWQIALERAVRSAQLPSGREALWRRVGRSTSEPGSPEAVALGCVERLAELLDGLPDRAVLLEWLGAIERLLDEVRFLNGNEEHSWPQLAEALRSIAALHDWTHDEPHSLDAVDVLAIVRECGAGEVHAAVDPVGRVRVVTPQTARGLEIGELFVLGFGESTYPRAESAGRLTEVDSKLTDSDEMLLFMQLASSPTRRLTLSYTALDDKAQPLPPSPLLPDLKACFPGQELPTTALGLSGRTVVDPPPRGRRVQRRHAVAELVAGNAEHFGQLLANPQSAPTARALGQAIDVIVQRAKSDRFGQFEGLLTGEAARRKLGRDFDTAHLWSPSQLELYAGCPFRFFAEQVLKLESNDRLMVETDLARRGSMLHSLLARLYRRQEQPTGEEEMAEAFLACLAEVQQSMRGDGFERSLQAIEALEIESWANTFAEQVGIYRQMWGDLEEAPKAAALEARFGPSSREEELPDDRLATDEPFVFRADGIEVRLTGRIDRLDVSRVADDEVFIVIDYKTGTRISLKPDEVRTGQKLQLPLYAMAAEQLFFSASGAAAWAVGYWGIREKGFGKAFHMQLHQKCEAGIEPTDEWRSLREEVLCRVAEIVRGVRGGDFPMYSFDEECTKRCPVRTVCRVGQARSLGKLWPPEPLDAGGEDAHR